MKVCDSLLPIIDNDDDTVSGETVQDVAPGWQIDTQSHYERPGQI